MLDPLFYMKYMSASFLMLQLYWRSNALCLQFFIFEMHVLKYYTEWFLTAVYEHIEWLILIIKIPSLSGFIVITVTPT